MSRQNHETEYVIRRMQKDDLPQVLAIEDACFSEPWSYQVYEEELAREGDGIWLFAAVRENPSQDKILGTISLMRMGDDGEIGNVAVLPSFRRRGIGTKLLSYTMTYGEEVLSMEGFTLEVRAGNEEAIRLYSRAGFKKEGVRPSFYQDPVEDAWIMWRRKEGV